MLTAQFTAENVVGSERDFSVRTGVVQFKADWPGVFIRGDDALGYAATIRAHLKQMRKILEKLEPGATTVELSEDELLSVTERREDLKELAELLESCRIKDGVAERGR